MLKYHWLMLLEAWKAASDRDVIKEEDVINNELIIKCLDKIPADMLA